MNRLQIGIILTLISAIFNGSTYLFSSLVLQKTNVNNMLFFWFLWAILIFIIYFLFIGKIKNLFLVIKNKQVATVGIINALSALCWSFGILYGGAGLTAFIYRFEIVFTILIGVIFLKEKLNRNDYFGIGIATLGAFIMAYRASNAQLSAVLIILLGTLLSSIAITFVKSLVKKIDPVSLAASRSFYPFLIYTLLGIYFGNIRILSPSTLLYTFLAAFLGAFLGFIILNKSFLYYEVSKAVVVRSIEPFFAAFLAFLFLNEKITVQKSVGAVLIAIGILILAKRNKLQINK